MEKILKLYTLVDGVNDTPFPSAENQVVICDFNYNATRMGGSPLITASVMYESCLDELWNDKVYASFNGERFFLKQKPSSHKTNTDARYKHDLELVSERFILENVYFYDVVRADLEGDDPKANSSDITFFGDLNQFATRLNESLKYSGVQYNVVVDDGVTLEDKMVNIDNEVFANALQKVYEVFNVPYYFDKRVIHIGYSSNALPEVFQYGAEDSLIKVSKENANAKIVNRCSGLGSERNIPYYYPNNSPKGIIEAKLTTTSNDFEITVENNEKFANNVPINGIIKNTTLGNKVLSYTYMGKPATEDKYSAIFHSGMGKSFLLKIETNGAGVLPIEVDGDFFDFKSVYGQEEVIINDMEYEKYFYARIKKDDKDSVFEDVNPIENGRTFKFSIKSRGKYMIYLGMSIVMKGRYSSRRNIRASFNFDYKITQSKGWELNGEGVYLKDLGIAEKGTPNVGDTIEQILIKYINPSDHLMPPIYRQSGGAKRFYNALNNTYLIPNTQSDYYSFKNPFEVGFPREHVIEVDDIYPTIKNVKNASNLPIDVFSEFAYDRDDNDETFEDKDGNVIYKHPYFFGKLRKTDGANGFNLFDSASEQGGMKVAMTTGHCGACEFEIAVDEDKHKLNLVQVDKDTNELLRDDDTGNVRSGYWHDGEVPQDWQQDTRKREVWVALKKDIDTYGVIMPNASGMLRPMSQKDADEMNAKEGVDTYKADKFVLLNINLPLGYITSAEEALKEEIIKFMAENNDDKFNFSIDFSRIYLEEHPEVVSALNENSRLRVKYNNIEYLLYVKSFSYDVKSNEALPLIRVELDENLTVNTTALQEAINSIESSFGNALRNIDIVGSAAPFFLRKDVPDTAQETIDFAKGVKFGQHGEILVDEQAGTKAVFDYLEVKKKATFTTLEIQKRTHVGGQQLITPASMVCSYIEDMGDYWRCYFETQGDGQEKIFNTFAVDDQAICQVFNETINKYYWRLVVGVGEDYIDLSKTDCDAESDIPEIGDVIIQLGNRTLKERQNAIISAAYGDKSPSFTQYAGIDSYTLVGKEVTRLSPYGNLLQGKVKIEEGSVGSANLTDLETGGSNLLRNSGFTGDYLSAQLNTESGLDGSSPMFSPNFDHWEHNGAEVADSVDAISKKEVVLTNGTLTQTMETPTIIGESYVLSFRAKGTSLSFSVGGIVLPFELTSEYEKYVYKFNAQLKDGKFEIIGNATLCDLQLERGTVVSGWSRNYADNQSELAYYEAIRYVSDAIKKGDTTILGGLILSNMIMLGKRDADGKFENSSGMSGIYNDNDDVAFWGGGDYNKAIDTVMKYKNDPQYRPNVLELRNMANFVITHGGRAILNDAIVRGKIYASEGIFNGRLKTDFADLGRVNISSNDLDIYENDNYRGRFCDIQMASNYLSLHSQDKKAIGRNPDGSIIFDDKDKSGAEMWVTLADKEGFVSEFPRYDYLGNEIYTPSGKNQNCGILVELSKGRKGEVFRSYKRAIYVKGDNVYDKYPCFETECGYYSGFRAKCKAITNWDYPHNYHLTKYDYNLLISLNAVNGDGARKIYGVYLPDEPLIGQRYEIWKQGTHELHVYSNGYGVWDMRNNKYQENPISFNYQFFGKIDILFAGGRWNMMYDADKK